MKYFILIMAVTTLALTGCAREAYYVDHEHGMATMDALDRQVVHTDYKHAGKAVDGMDGIHAETIMETYHETFGDSFSRENIDVTQTGAN